MGDITMKKHKLFLLILLIVIVAAIIFGAIIMNQFGSDRQLFQIVSEDVEQIVIMDGNLLKSATITNRYEIEKIVTLLNDFRFTTSEKNDEQCTGWSYQLTIYSKGELSDGKTYVLPYTEDSIKVDNAWYYGQKGYFKQLVDIAHTAPDMN